MAEHNGKQLDPDSPPGWSYNPAAWSQRVPIVIVAMIGFAIAMYLSLFQWDILPTVWEPFFGNQSRIILKDTWVSQLLPFPDAFLGALGYLADAIAGVIGGRARWRTMPWIVVLFGILVGPLGFVSIMLVVFQPVLFDAWCTLCLASAIASVVMIGPAMDEFLASLQYLKREKDRGKSVWRVFWGIGPNDDRGEIHIRAKREKVGAKWAEIIVTLIGVWLMAAPDVLGYDNTAAENADRIVGPIVATFGCVAIWEVTRACRWINLVLGVWLVLAPLFIDYTYAGLLNTLACGLAIVFLSGLPKGKIRAQLGGGWKSLTDRGMVAKPA